MITGLFNVAVVFTTAMESKNQNISSFHARSFQKLQPKKISRIFYSTDFGIFVSFTLFPGTRPRTTGTTLGYCPTVAPRQPAELSVVTLIRCIAKNEFKYISSIVVELMR